MKKQENNSVNAESALTQILLFSLFFRWNNNVLLLVFMTQKETACQNIIYSELKVQNCFMEKFTRGKKKSITK